ncbi:MAG TPA: two-component regulator propeller domain-containing protein [Bacteroidota bacterium]|nr:two-component regulator propeller domain-containing protein [Bacteroidota bacterium]
MCRRRFSCVPLLLFCGLIFYSVNVMAEIHGRSGIPEKYLTRFSIRSWSTAEGLPQSTVRGIVQTRDGFIWFGTQEGLVRFDGAQFDVLDRRNAPGIPHNDVNSLLELDDGSLLIGTFGGLAQLKDGQFVSLPQNLENSRIQTLYKDRQGVVWIGTMTDGMFSYADGRFQQYTVNEGLSSNSVTALAEDKDGSLWIGTNAGVARKKNDKITFLKSAQGLPSEDIASLCATSDSSMWIGTAGGLVRVKGGHLRVYKKGDGLSDNSIRCIFEDRKGDLWIGTEFGGVNRFSSGTFTSIGIKDGLSSNYVFSILADREGNLWIGTYTDGIDRLWEGKFAHLTVQNGFVQENPITTFEARDGSIWIGTISAGATRIDLNSVKKYDVDNGMPASFVRTIAQDTKGAVWLGTRSGLVRYDKGVLSTFTMKNGMSFDNVRALLALPDGSMWIGTTLGTIDEYKNGKFAPVKTLGLSNTVIRALFRDRSGNIWVGHNGGMIRWNKDEITTFSPADGSPSEPVYAFLEDGEGTLWIGTYGGGLYRLKGHTFAHMTTKVGLYDNVVFQILEDEQQNLWMSCNRGIYRVSKEELNNFADGKTSSIKCTSYGTSDGMMTSECNGNSQPAGCKTHDGKLIFPTAKGVVIINPKDLRTNSIPPPVVIEQAIIDGRSYPSTLSASVPAGKGELEFGYAGLSYTAPEKVKFRYFLDGYDDNWRDAGTRKTALYTNIQPGHYTFRVVACNNDGVWNLDGARFEFDIARHYYQARWFYLLNAIFFCAVIFAIYRGRVWQLLRREKILKQRVEESLAKIKVLGGLIPICSNCKKIRDDQGYWKLLEAYLQEHSEAKFSHGICPDCANKLYPRVFPKKKGS